MTFDRQIAARTLWQEARGESLKSQQAVAWTMRNRLKAGRWGDTLASVCLWRGQFSGWYLPHEDNFTGACRLAEDDALLVKLDAVLSDVLALPADQDPTGGSTHYVNPAVAGWPVWVKGDASKGILSATLCAQIGNHYFYKGVA